MFLFVKNAKRKLGQSQEKLLKGKLDAGNVNQRHLDH